MKKGITIYLEEDLHKDAKKRAVDVDMSLSEYIAILVRHEIDSDLILTLKNRSCKPSNSVA